MTHINAIHDIEHAQIRWDNGLPHSELFDDKYFCIENGLEESRYVFCNGNELIRRFKELSSNSTFTIIETGFGSGLNFICTVEIWEQHAPEGACLNYISIEKYPLSTSDLVQTLSRWPQIALQAKQLENIYSRLLKENQQLSYSSSINLRVYVMDVISALDTMKADQLNGDAWFLDGFDPKKNPDMWSQDVFDRMKPLSKAGATLATFTVAGSVVRGLRQAGFSVEKVKGYGRKRHMLKGKIS